MKYEILEEGQKNKRIEKLLNDIGVEIYNNIGEQRCFLDVMEDIKNNYRRLDAIQKEYVRVVLFGNF